MKLLRSLSLLILLGVNALNLHAASSLKHPQEKDFPEQSKILKEIGLNWPRDTAFEDYRSRYESWAKEEDDIYFKTLVMPKVRLPSASARIRDLEDWFVARFCMTFREPHRQWLEGTYFPEPIGYYNNQDLWAKRMAMQTMFETQVSFVKEEKPEAIEQFWLKKLKLGAIILRQAETEFIPNYQQKFPLRMHTYNVHGGDLDEELRNEYLAKMKIAQQHTAMRSRHQLLEHHIKIGETSLCNGLRAHFSGKPKRIVEILNYAGYTTPSTRAEYWKRMRANKGFSMWSAADDSRLTEEPPPEQPAPPPAPPSR